MSIRPVDMQVIVPKTSEIAHLRQIEEAKHGLNQHQFADQMEKGVQRETQTVIQTHKTEKEMINKDGRNNSGSNSKKKDAKKNKDDKKKETKIGSGLFDIKI